MAVVESHRLLLIMRTVAGLATITSAFLAAPVCADIYRAGPPVVLETTGPIGSATVGGLAGGGAVAVYGVFAGGLEARRFTAAGLPQGGSIQISTLDSSSIETVVGDPSGGFVVVWERGSGSPVQYNLYSRAFDAAGIARGPETLVSSSASAHRETPAIAIATTGDSFVLWTRYLGSGMSYEILARRLDVSAAPLGPPFIVASVVGFAPTSDVAALTGGDIVAVWQTAFSDPFLLGQRYDVLGNSIGGTFAINSTSVGVEEDPRIEPAPDGGFWVVWAAGDTGFTSFDILARQFTAAATPVSEEFIVNADATGSHSHPDLVVDPDGEMLVTWRSDPLLTGFLDWGRRLTVDGTFASNDFALVRNRRGEAGGTAATASGQFAVVRVGRESAGCNPGPPADAPATPALLIERLCDDGAAGCDVCPGFDDAMDGDSDGLPDGCDPCTSIGAQRVIGAPRLKIRRAESGSAKPDRVSLRGTALPAQPLSTLSPDADGMSVVLDVAGFGRLFDVTLDGGAFVAPERGWTVNASRTKFVYRNASPEFCTDGVAKLVLSDRSSLQTNLVKFKLVGIKAPWPVLDMDLPLSMTIIFGSQSAAAVGACAEGAWGAGHCALTDRGLFTLRCK